MPSKSASLAERTHQTVRLFIDALGDAGYDIGVLSFDGKMQRRRFDRENLAQNAPVINFWRSANAAGGNIYIAPQRLISPAGERLYSGIILIDDIQKSTVGDMRRSGYEPCAVVETSPGKYQAWVHISSKSFASEQIMVACRLLAQKFHGDRAAAQPGQFGRIPGFTNRKPKYEKFVNGFSRFPFCRLYYAFRADRDEQRYCSKREELVAKMREESQPPSPEKTSLLRALRKNRSAFGVPEKLLPSAARQDIKIQCEMDSMLVRLQSTYGKSYDPSRGDWMVINRFLARGEKDAAVARALYFSRVANLAERKKDIALYLELTFEKARNNLLEKQVSLPPPSNELALFIDAVAESAASVK